MNYFQYIIKTILINMITTINEYYQYTQLNNINKLNTLLEIFDNDINEEVDTLVMNEVKELIENNELELVSPEEFKTSLSKSKHKEMLSNYSIEELSKMKLYKVPGYNIGYALKPIEDGMDIVSVHNNEPSVRKIGIPLMKSAIKNGGTHLDHFDSKVLTNLYSSLGFVEYDRDEYNPKYDPDGSFKNKYGELAVIYRKLK